MKITDIEEIKSCVGQGWHDILDSLCKDIAEIAPKAEVFQVKEKFGALRFYLDHNSIPEGASYETDHLIVCAETQSENTCEYCGQKAEIKPIHNRGWLKAVCPEHYEKFK